MADKTLNPMVEDHPADTAYLIRCASSALARITQDLTELERWAEQCQGGGVDPWTADERRGLSLFAETIAQAMERLEVQIGEMQMPAKGGLHV